MSCLEFVNYNGSYSIIRFALVDAESTIIYIDVGTSGTDNDGSVYRLSSLKSVMDSNKLNFPDGYLLLADDAFMLWVTLRKPFTSSNRSIMESVVNYLLSRAQRLVKHAFGLF